MRWLEADATRLPPLQVDLVTMTGNLPRLGGVDPREVARHHRRSRLREHGFDVTDVRDAPDRPGRELVFLAERRG